MKLPKGLIYSSRMIYIVRGSGTIIMVTINRRGNWVFVLMLLHSVRILSGLYNLQPKRNMKHTTASSTNAPLSFIDVRDHNNMESI